MLLTRDFFYVVLFLYYLCSVALLFLLGCQYQCKWLTGKTCHDLKCVDGDVKPYSLTPLGFLSIYAYTLCRRTTKLDVVTCGWGFYIGVNHACYLKRAEFQRSPIFWFSSIYVYTLKSRTTKFGMVTYMGRRTCFKRSATPLHLSKCVARLVTDS